MQMQPLFTLSGKVPLRLQASVKWSLKLHHYRKSQRSYNSARYESLAARTVTRAVMGSKEQASCNYISICFEWLAVFSSESVMKHQLLVCCWIQSKSLTNLGSGDLKWLHRFSTNLKKSRCRHLGCVRISVFSFNIQSFIRFIIIIMARWCSG